MGKADDLVNGFGDRMVGAAGVRGDPAAVTDHPAHNKAGQYDGFARLAGAGMMPVDNLHPDPDQPRTEFDPVELDQLSESIKAHGILAPLRARWNPAVGKHIIVVGERRWRAAKLARLERVPVILVEGELSPGDILESQLAENQLRSNLNAIEQATAYRRYMELTGAHQKDLAGLLHVSPATISKALSLLDLDTTVQERVADGTISAKAGQAIAQIKDPVKQQQVAERAVAESQPAEKVVRQVRQKQGPAAPARKPVPTFTVARGIKVIVQSQRRLTGAEVVAMLEAATEQARTYYSDQQ